MEQNNIEARILEAAAEVFLNRGYTGTNMTRIAEAAGIGRPALYYYYRSKDRIFEAIIGNLVRSFVPGVLEIIRKDVPVENRLEELVDAYFEQLSKNPRLPVFIIREMNRDPGFLLSMVGDLHLENYFLSIMKAYREEVRDGHLKDVPPYSILMNLLGGAVTPFLFKPMIETAVSGGGNSLWAGLGTFSAFTSAWKPYVVSNLKNLLVPTPARGRQ